MLRTLKLPFLSKKGLIKDTAREEKVKHIRDHIKLDLQNLQTLIDPNKKIETMTVLERKKAIKETKQRIKNSLSTLTRKIKRYREEKTIDLSLIDDDYYKGISEMLTAFIGTVGIQAKLGKLYCEAIMNKLLEVPTEGLEQFALRTPPALEVAVPEKEVPLPHTLVSTDDKDSPGARHTRSETFDFKNYLKKNSEGPTKNLRKKEPKEKKHYRQATIGDRLLSTIRPDTDLTPIAREMEENIEAMKASAEKLLRSRTKEAKIEKISHLAKQLIETRDWAKRSGLSLSASLSASFEVKKLEFALRRKVRKYEELKIFESKSIGDDITFETDKYWLYCQSALAPLEKPRTISIPIPGVSGKGQKTVVSSPKPPSLSVEDDDPFDFLGDGNGGRNPKFAAQYDLKNDGSDALKHKRALTSPAPLSPSTTDETPLLTIGELGLDLTSPTSSGGLLSPMAHTTTAVASSPSTDETPFSAPTRASSGSVSRLGKFGRPSTPVPVEHVVDTTLATTTPAKTSTPTPRDGFYVL